MTWILIVSYCTLAYCDTFQDDREFKTLADCENVQKEYVQKNRDAPPMTIRYNSFLCKRKD